MLNGGEPADASARAQTAGLSVFGTIHPQLLNYGSAAAPAATNFASRFAPVGADNAPATTASVPSFDERFALKSSTPRSRSLQPAATFADRFGGAAAPAPAPTQFALASASATMVPVAPSAPRAAPMPAPAAPRAAARALAARVAPNKPEQAPERPATAPYRVASLGDTPIRTAYASVDSPSRDSGTDDSILKKMTPRDPAPTDAATKDVVAKDGPLAGIDLTRTAVYDIAARIVYLPNGQRLEAHSGLGEHMDEIRSVNLRSLGPTPPGLYELTMRE